MRSRTVMVSSVAFLATLTLSACGGGETPEPQPTQTDTPEPAEVVITPSPEELLIAAREARCLDTVAVFNQSKDVSIEAYNVISPERIVLSTSVTPTGEGVPAPSEATCIFTAADSADLDQATVDGVNIAANMFGDASVPAGSMEALDAISLRPLTTQAEDGTFLKYYGRLRVDLSDSSDEQCVAVEHISLDEARDSMFVSINGGDWIVLDLPTTEALLLSVTDTKVEGMDGEAIIDVRHRENMPTLKVGTVTCAS